MKIESTPYAANIVRPNAGQAKASEKTENRQESVSLSSRESAALDLTNPPVNGSKIAEIKEAIAQGRFKINPEAIADRLLDTAREMISKQRQA
ncbi:MAG: flagellar biosynthesis anti-sigma factor FlgM [Azonexus sp.]|jgi:negative regulator of flagellin synthesis FlgM